MICRNCGFENEEGKAFCASCGASLEVADASPFDAPQDVSAPYEVSEDYTIPAYDETQDYSTPVFEAEAYNADGKKKNNEKLPIILGAVSLALSILSSCCCNFIPIVNYITFITLPISLGLAIAAIVVGSKAMKQAKLNGEKDKFATIGLVLGVVTIALAVIGLILGIVLIVVGGAGLIAGELFGDSYYYY